MIQIGKRSVRTIEVDETRAISFMGPELRVYSTPSILSDIEFVCRDLLLPMLEDGADSVGLHVTLDHLGAVTLGRKVEVVATLAAIDKRKITLFTSVSSEGRAIANASHIRAIVTVTDLKAKIGRL
jgi:fluoroacetyl-CoA thioesterase